jgi:hypothetical protein
MNYSKVTFDWESNWTTLRQHADIPEPTMVDILGENHSAIMDQRITLITSHNITLEFLTESFSDYLI